MTHRRHNSPWLVAVILPALCLAAIVGAGYVSLQVAPQWAGQDRSPVIRLSAEVDSDVLLIRVTNRSVDDWRDVRITINRCYTCDLIPVIRSGATYENGMTQFIDRRGNRLLPNKAAMDVEVTATVPQGPGVYRWQRSR